MRTTLVVQHGCSVAVSGVSFRSLLTGDHPLSGRDERVSVREVRAGSAVVDLEGGKTRDR